MAQIEAVLVVHGRLSHRAVAAVSAALSEIALVNKFSAHQACLKGEYLSLQNDSPNDLS
jgi:hypothetical protein